MDGRTLEADVVVPCTGFRPDLDILRELRLNLDPAVEAPTELGPLIDPEFHSCGTVAPHGAKLLAHPDKDFYIVGMKSYGRAPTFLLATGYEQVRSVAAALAGDREAADTVQLELPETGVCSSDAGTSCDVPAAAAAPESSCCAAPEPVLVGFPTGLSHGRSGDQLTTYTCLRHPTHHWSADMTDHPETAWACRTTPNSCTASATASPTGSPASLPQKRRTLRLRVLHRPGPDREDQTHLPSTTEHFANDRLNALAKSKGAVTRDVPEVLFVCVQNAGRSQMAAALLIVEAKGRIRVRSAGSLPAAELDPAVVAAMSEMGLDLTRDYPKPLTDDVVRASDVVITMGCGDSCPIYPGKRYEDWELTDPAGHP